MGSLMLRAIQILVHAPVFAGLRMYNECRLNGLAKLKLTVWTHLKDYG